jgi:hypothetical protein
LVELEMLFDPETWNGEKKKNGLRNENRRLQEEEHTNMSDDEVTLGFLHFRSIRILH